MGTIHRLGIPPKRLLYKKVLTFSDMEFNEDRLCEWARESINHHMQYDYVAFNGSKGKLNREIELTVWFQTRADAALFIKDWVS